MSLKFVGFALIFAFVAMPASADKALDKGPLVTIPLYVECSGKGQVCDRTGSVALPAGSRQFAIVITAPAGHCSDIRYRIIGADGDEIFVTDWLAPGANSAVATIGSAHVTSLEVQAEGRPGGCNVGRLGSWAATVVVAPVNEDKTVAQEPKVAGKPEPSPRH